MNAAMQLRHPCRKVVICSFQRLERLPDQVPVLIEMKPFSSLFGVNVPQGSFVEADGPALISGCHFYGGSF